MKVQIELTEGQVKQVMDEIQKVLFDASNYTEPPVESEPEFKVGEKKISDDVIDHIKARVDAGESLGSVCKEYNLNYNTVYGRLNKEKKKSSLR